jgi:hypothetical protein
LAAAHAGPQIAFDEAIVHFGAVEVVKLALSDMPYDADMRASGLEGTAPVADGKIATVPGAVEQRRELIGSLEEVLSAHELGLAPVVQLGVDFVQRDFLGENGFDVDVHRPVGTKHIRP